MQAATLQASCFSKWILALSCQACPKRPWGQPQSLEVSSLSQWVCKPAAGKRAKRGGKTSSQLASWPGSKPVSTHNWLNKVHGSKYEPCAPRLLARPLASLPAFTCLTCPPVSCVALPTLPALVTLLCVVAWRHVACCLLAFLSAFLPGYSWSRFGQS